MYYDKEMVYAKRSKVSAGASMQQTVLVNWQNGIYSAGKHCSSS
tara:strand:+ start:268 stop:399 length:132 start_codon:yes stop_codon:yes gene_type:complete